VYGTSVRGASVTAAGAATATQLPVTGGDLMAFVIIGAALIAAGFVLLRSQMRGRASA
jgi:LPXTG-motif cell wall-anchored protein